MTDEKYVWQENVERLTIYTPRNNRIIHKAADLIANESVIYAIDGGETYIGLWDTPIIDEEAVDEDKNRKVFIPLWNDAHSGLGIDGHIEEICKGPSGPKAYEVVVDEIFDQFENLGSYAVLKAEVKKQNAIKDLISKLK